MTERSPSRTLSGADIELLSFIASGYKTSQMTVRFGETIGRFQIRRRKLYSKLGGLDLGHKARAFVLARAIAEYQLEPPDILVPAINKLRSGEYPLPPELDIEYLRSIAEGRVRPAKSGARGADVILGSALADLGLAPYPPFCLVAATIWAGLTDGLSFDRTYEPTEDDRKLVLCLALDQPLETLAGPTVTALALQARSQALQRRLGVSNEAMLVGRAIRDGWLPLPAHLPAVAQRCEAIAQQGLLPWELAIIRGLENGLSRLRLADAAAESGKRGNPDHLTHRLYQKLGVTDAASAVAHVMWAGRPEAPPVEPIDPTALTEEETALLDLLITGQTAANMAKQFRGGVSTQAVQNCLRALYNRLGVHTSHQAVALAARGGFYRGRLDLAELAAVDEASFAAPLLLRLSCWANGRDFVQELRAAYGWSLNQYTYRMDKPGNKPGLGIADIRLMVLLIELGKLEVTLPDSGLQFVANTEAEPSPGAAPEAEAKPEAEPEPASQPDDSGLITQYQRLAGRVGHDKEVNKRSKVVSHDLGRYIEQHFADLVRLTRAGLIQAPAGSALSLSKVREKNLSVQNQLFLSGLADGLGLVELQRALGETDTRFKQRQDWLCRSLLARTIREAVLIALWAGFMGSE